MERLQSVFSFILRVFLLFLFNNYFSFLLFDGKIESGGMKCLDGKRLVFPQGALDHLQVNGVALRKPQGVCVRQTQQSKLGQEHHKPEVRSREK